jgi:hypothetical protein
LMLPESFVESVYGPSAGLLRITDDVTGRVSEMLSNPAPYWKAVLDTRKHLAEHHTFQHRFQELTGILEGKA